MKKLSPVMRELLEQSVLALLLALGVSIPLMLALNLSGQLFFTVLCVLCVTLVCALCVVGKTTRLIALLAVGLVTLAQFLFPGMGLIGGLIEAVKALMLKFAGLDVAMPLFGRDIALLMSLLVGVFSFLFSKRGAGFLPAALLLVMTLFLLWNMGRADLLWFCVPAMISLLLIIAVNAHEKNTVLRALPMALICALLAMALLPASRVTIPPLEQAASSLKQAITDYLFFTEPRNVFTLGSYGYYPTGGSQLGGAAVPSEYPVMIVKTDKKVLLRGVIKDEYTGRAFRDTSSAKRYLYINPRWSGLRRTLLLENMPSQAIQNASHLFDQKAISIQMQNTAASTLFTPLYVRKLNTTGDMVAYFNDASELFITRDLKQGDSYTVYAPIFEGGDSGLSGLVETAGNIADTAYAGILAEYTQLPGHMEQKMIDDVQSIVASSFTPYDKALAIQRHLQRYYTYTLTPDTPPANNDFVTYFLYRGREGYCTYFASAMAVMCRMAGLPTRYVEGFLAQPAADGFAYVTGKEAHAWVEIYFKGFGWIPFDPTPGQQDDQQQDPPPPDNQNDPPQEPDPTPTPDPQQPDPTPSPEPDDPPTDEPSPPPDTGDDSPEPDENKNDPPFPWWILLILALLIALGARLYLRMPDRVASKQPLEKEKLFVYGGAVNAMLLILGRKPKPGETYARFGARLDAVKALPVQVGAVYRMMSLCNYGGMQPTKKQTQRAREICLSLMKSLRFLPKLRFLMALVFQKNVYHTLDTPMPSEQPKQVAMRLFPPKTPEKGKKR